MSSYDTPTSFEAQYQMSFSQNPLPGCPPSVDAQQASQRPNNAFAVPNVSPLANINVPTRHAGSGVQSPLPAQANLTPFDTSLTYDPRNPSLFSNNARSMLRSSASDIDHQKNQTVPSLSVQQGSSNEGKSHVVSLLKGERPGVGEVESDHELEEGELDDESTNGDLFERVESNSFLAGMPQTSDTALGMIAQTPAEWQQPENKFTMNDRSATERLILELQSWGLTFSDLLGEVTYPDALRAIYEEMGLSKNTGDETSSNPMRSQPEANAVDKLPIDRKALIAQKLAAKTTRPSASPHIQELHVEANESKAYLPESEAAGEIGQKKSPKLDVPKPHPDSVLNLEAQRKAQNELARQRIEALKLKMKTQTASEPVTVGEQRMVSAGYSPVYDVDATFEANHPPPTVIPPRKPSYFSPVSQSSLFNIPGLLSSANVPSREPAQVEHVRADEPELGATSDMLDRTSFSADAEHGLADESRQPISDKATVAIGNQAQKKRSEASNWLDQPTARPTTRPAQEDGGVIIDISDDESDHAGDVNPTTNGSEHHQFGQNPGSAKLYTSLDRVVSMDQSSHRMNMSTSTSDTPTALLAPNLQELEDLRAKEIKIQSLTRRIAEMEAKREAKKAGHAASRVQSPRILQKVDVQHASTVPNGNGTSDLHKSPTILDPSTESTGTPEPATVASSVQPRSPARSYRGSQPDSQVFEDQIAVAQSKPQHDESRQLETTAGATSVPQPSRQAEIECGLPLLEEEIERAKRKLQLLKQQELELETEIQKGLQGKQMLLDELRRLSQATQAIQGNESMNEPTSYSAEHEFHGSRPAFPNAQNGISVLHEDFEMHNHAPPGLTQSNQSPAREHPPQYELEEDVMDTSRTEADEGVISDQNNEELLEAGVPIRSSMAHDEDNKLDEAVDLIEPYREHTNNDTEAHPQIASPVTANENLDDAVMARYEPAEVHHFDLDDQNIYEPPNDIAQSEGMETPPGNQEAIPQVRAKGGIDPVESMDEGEISPAMYAEALLASDVEESGSEYEPPEASLEREPETHNQDSAQLKRKGYFVPYESPLKHFKSQQSQLWDVGSPRLPESQDTGLPFCRWEESGGRCNDAGCKSQHLRNV